MYQKLKYAFTFCAVLYSFIGNTQRYLTPVFDAVNTTTDIVYGNADDYLGNPEVLELDFYEPAGDTLDLRPMVLYVHGGGFVDTNQSKSLIHIAAFCDSLARRGYVTASINYRLDTSISNRAVINAMHDAKAAVRFFKANYLTYKVDTNLMFIGGESAGAITSMTTNYINLPAEPSFPSTLPLASDLSLEGASGNPGHSSNTKGTMCFCGGTKTVFEESLFDTLAINNSADPVLLVVHGTADPLIPTIRAVELAIRAENIGLPYLFYTMPGATHCPWFFPLENSWEYLDTLISYTVPFLYACVSEPVGISENVVVNPVKIFPNPSHEILNINLESTEPVKLEILDAQGRIIYQTTINGSAQINSADWDNGIYLVRFPEKGWTRKIIKN